MSDGKLSRRTLLKAAGGLQLGVFLTANGLGPPVVRKVPLEPRDGEVEADLAALVPMNLYVRVDTDDTVRIVNPRPDMGQGPRTSLPKHVAEELDADWEKVVVEQADADSRYGNQTSGGSTSTRNFWTPMREAGAKAREMLVRAAGQRWGVDPSECRAESGAVVHDASGRRLTYGELASEASLLPEPGSVKLKDPSEYRLVGRPTKRVDGPALVTGSAEFGYDVKIPGMVHVAIARPHAFGGRARDYDDTQALQVPGVQEVVRYGTGVAVVADHTWAAFAGRDALTIDWDDGPYSDLDDDAIRSGLIAGVGPLPGLPGDAAVAVEAAYDLPYLSHSPMEPMNCVADARANRCEVWAPTQAPGTAQSSVARTLGLSQDEVTVHVTFVGGGFGRRLSVDYATEAARLSRDLGVPVQVCWSRDDDMRHDYYRPASHHAMRGGLNSDGEVVALHHRAAIASTEGGVEAMAIPPSERAGRPDQERPPYSIRELSASTSRVPFPIPTGAWRSVNNTQWSFANESFLDELAAAGGHDPFELRRRIMSNSRLRGAMELAAQEAGWGTPMPAGSGRGIACFAGYGTYVSQVVEVSVSPDGEVAVTRVVAAVDCGIAVNPLGIKAQLEGASCDGLSTALKAAITIKDGGVEQTSFRDYEWFRMRDLPPVECHIVVSRASPGGMGEPGFPAVSPALANAIYMATGRRVRRLPIRAADLAGWAPDATATPTAASSTTPTSEPSATPTPKQSETPAPGDEGRIYLPWSHKSS